VLPVLSADVRRIMGQSAGLPPDRDKMYPLDWLCVVIMVIVIVVIIVAIAVGIISHLG